MLRWTRDRIPSDTPSISSNSIQWTVQPNISSFNMFLRHKFGSHGCSLPSVTALGPRDTSARNNANTSSSASSVMYQPTPTTSSDLTFSNGHLPPSPPTFTHNPPVPSDSESDLSEPVDAPSSTAIPPHTTAPDNSVSSIEQGFDDRELTSEDALGSDDGDYDMEDSPPPTINVAPSPSSRRSSQSQTLGKRKAGVDEDEHMLNNPELYGLRRSVRHLSFLLPYSLY